MNLLEQIGLTNDELAERVVDKVADHVLHGVRDEDGEWTGGMREQLKKQIQSTVDAAVAKIAGELVAPSVEQMVRNHVFQITNGYGEAKGEPVSLSEYLARRLMAYMEEPVDLHGKTKADAGYGDFRKSNTRAAWLVERTLSGMLENAAKDAIRGANEALVGGIQKAALTAIADIGKKLRVEVKV